MGYTTSEIAVIIKLTHNEIKRPTVFFSVFDHDYCFNRYSESPVRYGIKNFARVDITEFVWGFQHNHGTVS